MNRYQAQARLACQISIGLMAGVFSIVPVVEASPVQDAASAYNKGGVTVVPGPVTKVTSTTQNNIVAWKDFSVAQGETVQFDGGNKTNNYLNVVTGNATSEIAGKIEGGNDVYLVNPHGVIFSKTAQVDVGNLYVSTQDVGSAVNAYYTDGKAGGAVLQAGTAQADIVNLGKIKADKVEADGTHIRFLNSEDVTAKSGVVLNAVGDDAYVHVGNEGGTDAGYKSTKGNAIDYYQLVSNVTKLQNIENGLGKNYMLSEDIDASGIANFTPLGDSTTPFSGKFDGMFHEIRNLTVNTSNNAGLFGDIKGTSNQKARVENLGLVGAKITSSSGYAGAIAGNADYALIQNVYSEAGSSGAISGKRAGGILGSAGGGARQSDTIMIRRAYNTVNSISGGNSLGGIVGASDYGTSIEDVYSTNASTDNSFYGITRLLKTSGGIGQPTVIRAYAPQSELTNQDKFVTGGVSGITGSFTANKNFSTYTAAGWTDGTDISNDGTTNTTWRIYEGQGTPLLTAFLKGTVTASYRYNYFTNPTDQAATTDGLALAGVTGTTDGSDIKATYNAQYFKIADSTGQKAGTVSDITFSGGVKAGDNDVVIDSRVSGSGIRNVSDSGAFISSTQHGYNIVGGNLSIASREVKVQGGTYHITKEYDGTADATSALLAAMNGSSSGYQVTGLLANDTVELAGITATYQGNGANGRAAKDADTGKSVTVNASGIGLKDTKNNGAEKNYKLNTSSLSSFSVTGDIIPRTLYLTVKNSGFTKTYDGNTSITDTNAAPSTNLTIDATKGTAHQLATVTSTSGGTTSSTTDTITYDTSKTTVEYADKNAGQNKNIYYKNISLTGANAYNYTLLAENAQSATGYDVLYDATTGQASSSAVLTTAGNIDPRVIDPTKFSVKDAQGNVSPSGTKPYDGEAAFDSTGYTLVAPSAAATGNTGIISGENITFSIVPGKANFLDASGNQTSQVNDATKIGYNIKATAGADTNTGGTTVLSNYIWGKGGSALDASKEYQVTTAGSITPRDLSFTVTQPTTVSIDKEYNGDTALDKSSPYYTAATTFGSGGYVDYASGSKPIVTDRVNGGTPTLTVTAVYDNKNVNRTSVTQPAGARGIDYTVTLGGANAANYTINGQSVTPYTMKGSATGAKGIITPKDLTLSLQNPTKVYDGDTTLPTKYLPSGTPAGVYANDSVQYGTSATGAYHSKNVNGDGTTWTDASGWGWKNWVEYSNLSLTGNDALNYDIAQTATVGGTITPLALAASDFSYTYHTISKEYDGKTDVSSADAFNGLATVRVTSTGDEFKNASVNHTKNLTASYANPNSQNQTLQNVTYGFTILDDQSGNYTLPASGISVTPTAANAGRITPRKVVAAATDNNLTKTYDATAAAQAVNGQSLVSYTYFDQSSGQPSTAKPALVGTDADASTGAYQDSSAGANDAADAGTGKTVLYTPSISTGDTSNYEVVDAQGNAISQPTGGGTIDKRNLTVTFANTSKVYDTTSDVPKDATHIVPTLDDGSGNSVIGADGTKADFDITQIVGEYRDAQGKAVSDVGTNYDVAYSNLLAALVTHAKNYTINGGTNTASGTGDITQLPLNNKNFHFNFGTLAKEYDGSADVAYTDRQNKYHAATEFINEHYVDMDGDGQYTAGTDVLLGGASASGLNVTSATYANKDAGQNKSVTYLVSLGNLNNYNLSGLTSVTSGNATLSYANGTLTAKTTGSITPRMVYASLKNPTPVTKVYKGTTDVEQNIMGDVQMNGLLTGTANDDGVQLDTSATQAAYADKNAGQGKNVIYHVTLTGTGAGTNYQVVDAAGAALPTDAIGSYLMSSGTGTITKAPLTIDFAAVNKTYDGSADVTTSSVTGDQTTISPTLSGFVGGDSAVAFDSTATALIKGNYTNWDGQGTLPQNAADANVNHDSAGNVTDKAVYYTGVDTAFSNLAGRNATLDNYELTGTTQGGMLLSAANNGVKDTVYFSEALQKGRIKPLSLTMGQIKENWTTPITKEYDTTNLVLNPMSHFSLYVQGSNGTQIPVGYTLSSATYSQADQGSHLPVTYTLAGISQQSLGNFVIDASIQAAYQNAQITTTGDIAPKKLYAGLLKATDLVKTYDGTPDAATSNLAFYDANGNQIKGVTTDANGNAVGLDGIYASDSGTVSTAVTANYNDKNATIDPGAAHTNAKTVNYVLTLNDTLRKGNYELAGTIDSSGTAALGLSTASAAQNTYAGTGDIKRRQLVVDFANGQPTGIDKPYNGTDAVNTAQITGYPSIFTTGAPTTTTGVVTVNGVTDDAHVDTSQVQAAYASPHVQRDQQGMAEAQDVNFSHFLLKGADSGNYVISVAQANASKTLPATLVGKGTINPKIVDVWIGDKKVTKEYDHTKDVCDYVDAAGVSHMYAKDNVQHDTASIVTKDTLNIVLGGTPKYTSEHVTANGNNPVTYDFTWNNNSSYDSSKGNHDYDVNIRQGERGSVTGNGANATAQLVTDGTIKPRVLTLQKPKKAEKMYDGTPLLTGSQAGQFLTFDRVVMGDDVKAMARGTYQATAAGNDASDATAGLDPNGNSLLELQHDVDYTNITLGNSDYTLSANSPTTVKGTGIIKRATITLKADPVSVTQGNSLPASYQGTDGKWYGTDGWFGTDANGNPIVSKDLTVAGYKYDTLPNQTSNQTGSYGIYAWYRSGTDAQGNALYTQLVNGTPYDKNYVLEQDPANATALAITARQPVVPPVNVPADIEQATAIAKKFTPDRRAYNHASHDEMNSVVREPQAGLAYADGGVNAGHVVTLAGGDVSHSMMDVQGQGEVVNLMGGDAAQGAMRDVTRHGKSFTLTGSLAAYGLSEEAAAQLQAQAGTSGPEETATAGIKGGNVNAAEGQPQGNLLGTKGGNSSRGISGSEPVVQQSGGNSAADASPVSPVAGATLFHDASEGYPGHLAATEDAHLFDDAVPAVTAAGEAHVSLFDDSSETAGREHSSHGASGAAVSLFGDEPAAQPASGAGISASGAVKAQTSSADEEDEKEKEEAAHAAALKAKGADIGIESEGAGVNLAG